MIEAMKQALEALETAWYHVGTFAPTDDAIELYDQARTSLRQAIEQAEKQEPVAWGVFDGPNLHDVNFTEEEAHEMMRLKGDGSVVKPLYTDTQPQMQSCAGRNCGSTNPNLHSAECFEDYEKSTGMNQWHGLTNDEIEHIADSEWEEAFVRMIEAKLKEKNT